MQHCVAKDIDNEIMQNIILYNVCQYSYMLACKDLKNMFRQMDTIKAPLLLSSSPPPRECILAKYET